MVDAGRPYSKVFPDFNGVNSSDAAYLREHPFGYIPGAPYKKPGEGRFGQFTFDKRALLKRCDLSIARRKEVIFLSTLLGKLDHFEFFEVEPTDDRKQIKRAFFAFSKRFHPDTFFNANLGAFEAQIEQLFRYASDVYELLNKNKVFRETYVRAMKARDAAYRAELEREREEKREVSMRRKRLQAEDRKAELTERLSQNIRTRRGRKTNPVKEGLERAKRYYDQGIQMYESSNFVRAASMLQLAVGLDPANETYRKTFERVETKASQSKAEIYWKRGQMEQSLGRDREAVVHFLRAVETYPRADYCAHTGEVLLSLGMEMHRAVDLATLAVEADPQNVDYLTLLGHLYEAVELFKKALNAFERALEVAPDDEEIKRAIKALKRK